MESRKVLSGLCYFSIFFAGFIFPLVVLLASSDQDTKRHAKHALISHIIPFITLPFLFFAIFSDLEALNNNTIPMFTIITIIVTVLATVIVAIWNVIKGVKVFIQE